MPRKPLITHLASGEAPGKNNLEGALTEENLGDAWVVDISRGAQVFMVKAVEE